jgi:hypothetical protein
MTKPVYYSLGPEHEFETHKRIEKAKASAQEHIVLALDDHWHEGTDRIEYGILLPIAVATEVNRRPSDNPEFAFLCEYELKPTGTTDAAMLLTKQGFELESQRLQLIEAKAEIERLSALLLSTNEMLDHAQEELRFCGRSDRC